MKQKDLIRANELKELIKKYDFLYYENGISEISDAEYDRLYDEYLKLEEKYPELKEMADSPTKRVGAGDKAGTTTGLPKFTHKSPLLSIDRKAKELSELKDFYDKCGGDGVEVIIQPKLDGITCNVNYENGKFVNAATRGNGYIGDLITENFKATDTKYPNEINDNASLELRGEAIIPYDFFKENLVDGYSNPRNAVAGIMRQITPEDVKGKGVKVLFYDFGETKNMMLERNDSNNVDFIKSLGFGSIPTLTAKSWEELKDIVETKLNGMIQEIEGFNILVTPKDEKHDLEFPQAMCDGLVIKVNDRKLRDEIGMSEKGPKWAFAFKFKPLQAETRINHIEYGVGKSGKVTPVAVFDEINLGGTKITKATLNNYDYMQSLPVLGTKRNNTYVEYSKPVPCKNCIKVGDVLVDKKWQKSQGEEECKIIVVGQVGEDGFWIEQPVQWSGEWYEFEDDRYYLLPEQGLKMDDILIVERSNDVIPRVVAIKHRGYMVYNDDFNTSMMCAVRKETFEEPKVCPVCGKKLLREGPLHFCTNPLCSAQIKNKIEHYASRDAMNIVGLGEGIVEVLFEKGFLIDLPSIYRLHNHRDLLIELEKFGERKVDKLLKSIEDSKNPELWQFIYALSIDNIGKRASKDLAQRYHTLENFMNATKEELLSMESIGEVMANTIIEFINSDMKEVIQELLYLGVEPKEVEIQGEKYKGMTFVITGTLKEPRTFYQNLIEKNGGKVSGSVSKKTNVVLIGAEAGSKETKARDLLAKGADIELLDTQEKVDKYFGL